MTVRALPHLRFKDPETQRAYDAIREALQEGNGERGNPNNRWLTVADLDGSIKQVITTTASSGGGGDGGGGTDPNQAAVILTVNPASPLPNTEFTVLATVTGNNPTGTVTFKKDGADPISIVMASGQALITQSLAAGSYVFTAEYSGDDKNNSASTSITVAVTGGNADGLAPPAPLTLTATPEAWAIRLEWTQPELLPPDYLTTEIWCSTTTPTIAANRTKVGEIAGTVFTFTGLGDDLLSTDDTYYFWVRNRDTEDLTSTWCPANDVGVEGKSLPSPNDLIDDLVGDIVNSDFYNYLGAKVRLLQGPEGIPNSVNARLASQKNELVQMIEAVEVSGNGTIDPYEIWHFDADVQGWSGSNVNVSATAGALVATATADNGIIWSPVLATPFLGSAYHAIRVRFKQVVGTGWEATVKFKDTSNTVHTHTITTPSGDFTDYSDFDWDLGDDTNWTGNTIKQIGFVLDNNADKLNFDWITVGRLAPGASYSQVEAIRVRSDKKNRAFFQPSKPTDPYPDGYALVPYDLWFDTDDGNKPYRWAPPAGYTSPVPPASPVDTHWAETTDTRLAESWAEIYDIKNATANPSGAAAQRINGIAANATSAVNSSAANAAAIAAEQTARADADTALAQQITQISAGVNVSSRVFIGSTQPTNPINGYTLRVNDLWYDTTNSSNVLLKYWDDTAWVVRRTDTKVYYTTLANRPSANLMPGDLWFDTGKNNEPWVWNGTWVKVFEGYINGLADAKITTFEQTKVGYATVNTGFTHGTPATTYAAGEVFDDAGRIYNKGHVDAWNAANPSKLLTWRQGLPLATAVKQIGIRTVDGQSTTIEEQATAIYGPDGLRSQWSVKVDSNGWVSGFGLSSTPSTDGNPFSDFGVRADRFYVAAPNTPKTQPQNLSYFALESGTTTNGVAIVFRKATFSAYGVTTRWIYFKATNPGQIKDDQWAVIKDVASSSLWNTNWLVDHVGPKIVYNDAGQLLRNENTLANVDASTVFIQIESATEYNSLPTTGTTKILNSVVQATATTANIPFIVLTGDRSMNGATYKPGVYATNAYIKKAQITEAAIADAAITNAKIGNVIQSVNYVAGSSGWKIDKVGGVEFNNGTWRGTLQSSLFDGTTNNPAGTTGWQINANGNAYFNTVIVRSASKNISNGSMIRMRVWGGQGTNASNVPNNTTTTIWSSSYGFLHAPGSLITVLVTVQFECPTQTVSIFLEATDGTNTSTKTLYDRADTDNPTLGSRFFNATTMFLLYVPSTGLGTIRLKVRHQTGNNQANYRDITLHTQEMYA